MADFVNRIILEWAERNAKVADKANRSLSLIQKQGNAVVTTTAKMNDSFKGVEHGLDSWGHAQTRLRDSTGRFVKAQDAFNTSIKESINTMPRFRFEFLGLLFFGMMLRRMFEGLARSAWSTYMKMTQGQTKTAQSLIGLTAAWEYLKFSIGSAIGTFLEPYMDTIMDIVEGIVDWIDQNPQLVGQLLMLGIIIGGLMQYVGSFVLGLLSIQLMIANLTGGAGIGALGASLIALAPLLFVIGALAGVAAAMWMSNFANIQEHTQETANNMYNILTTAWDAIISSLKGDWKQFDQDILQMMYYTVKEVVNQWLWMADVIIGIANMVSTRFGGPKLPSARELLKGMFPLQPVVPTLQYAEPIGPQPLMTTATSELTSATTNLNKSFEETLNEVSDLTNTLKERFPISTGDGVTGVYQGTSVTFTGDIMIDLSHFAGTPEEALERGEAAGKGFVESVKTQISSLPKQLM